MKSAVVVLFVEASSLKSAVVVLVVEASSLKSAVVVLFVEASSLKSAVVVLFVEASVTSIQEARGKRSNHLLVSLSAIAQDKTKAIKTQFRNCT